MPRVCSVLRNAKTKPEPTPRSSHHSPAHAAPRPRTRTSPAHTTHGRARSRATRLRAALPRRAEATPTSAALLRSVVSYHRFWKMRHHVTREIPEEPPAPKFRHQERTPLFHKTRALRPAARPEYVPEMPRQGLREAFPYLYGSARTEPHLRCHAITRRRHGRAGIR